VEVVRLGIVGCGLITQLAHLPALALEGRFAVVGVADPSQRARAAVAARTGARAYARHEDLLDREALDALLVASPNGTHARVVLDALAAGLHVLVEKPLCLTADDADRIVALTASRRRVVQVGYMKRHDPAYEAFRDRLPAAQELRLIASVTVDPGIGERYRPDDFAAATDVDPSRLDAETAVQVAAAIGDEDPRHVRPFSDAFLGALVHDVNLVLGLGVEPTRVTDAASASDGSLAYGAWDVGGARWTAAWMLLPGADAFTEDVRAFAADGERRLSFPAPYEGPSDSYRRQLAHFHDCVTKDEPCRTPASQGARDVALLTELYRAAM
jgi:predicted dehydrogenase